VEINYFYIYNPRSTFNACVIIIQTKFMKLKKKIIYLVGTNNIIYELWSFDVKYEIKIIYYE